MKAKINNILLYSILFFYLTAAPLLAQEQFTPVDIKAVGDRSWRRWGAMSGNLVGVTYWNTGQVGKVFPNLEWPIGSMHQYLDTVVPLVAAEAVDVHGNIIHPLETNYEYSLDISPDGLTEWGWQPLPGYLNLAEDSPAISNKKITWPDVWPDRPDWAGFWNGYFGRDQFNADQETYFVMDDDADEEFEYYPDSNDPNRRGIGMRVSVRGLQWSHVLAEDCVFWIYDVTNVSTTNYEKALFGMFIDSKNGGHDYDNGYYDTFVDLTYIWDQEGIGDWGGPTGWIGYGYLESPGLGNDGIDNDEDGLTDENRDSGPGELVFGPIGIYGPDKQHWSGDEDGDWNPETDDVGADGVGPLDAAYPGPDAGEGDGIPTDGEPNFDRTDLDESDQIGLQAVSLHSWWDYPLHEDELIWDFLANHAFDPVQNYSNIGVLYSSGPFPLAANRTERFSMALLLGEDFDDLIRNKDIVQRIFNANYRFARPPDKPTVKAIAGDGFVTLIWDNKAEFSRDPFLGIDPDSMGYKKDFEGYLVYKSTDPGLLDARLITDAFGNKIFRKPQAQFDLINNVKGTDLVGLPNGAHFYLGNDTGLAHSWTDSNVVNGQSYFYAVVSYDAGDPELGANGLPPSQCTCIIERDLFSSITTDVNTVLVTPGVPAAGYQSPEVEQTPEHISGSGSGYIEISVVHPAEVAADQHYRVTFRDTIIFEQYSYKCYTVDYSVVNLSQNKLPVDQSIYLNSTDMFPFFDGLAVRVFNDEIAVLPNQSGLSAGVSNFSLAVSPDTFNICAAVCISGLYPADYEIKFSANIVDTSRGSEIGLPEIPVNFTVYNLTDDLAAEFLFIDADNDGNVTAGDEIFPLIDDGFSHSPIGYRTTWRIKFIAPAESGKIPPQPGDVFTTRVSKPFRSGDTFEFRSLSAVKIEKQAAKADLDLIAVVPNPYVVTNPLEPRNLLTSGRGKRVIQFIHLPQNCTIRIFTLRGHLVDTIEHNSSVDDGTETWDLVSHDGIDISFGIYIFHVEAGGIGNKIGKFALVK